MKFRSVLFAVLAVIVLFFSFSEICYGTDNDNLSWFILISDTHIGAGDDCEENLSWIVNDAYDVINPITIINTGDLTDQHPVKNALGGEQDEGQWREYNKIVFEADMNRIAYDAFSHAYPVYADGPGNHDSYNEIIHLANYLKYSVQGIAAGKAQQSWFYQTDYGKYHFIMIDTTHLGMTVPWVDGRDNDCPGELDFNELGFIDNTLGSQNTDLSFLFGHHAIGREGESDWGRIIDGRSDFIQLLDIYNVSFYGHGHVHSANDPYYLNSETLVYNVKSLGKDNKYAIVAVDNGYISVTEAEVEKWPVVLITEPLDKDLGADKKLKTYSPFARSILTKKDVPIRVLIFSKDPVHVDDVEFRYREDKWTKHFKPISDITRGDSLNGENSHLWIANWDASKLKPGNYLIRVDAKKSFDQIAVKIETFLDIVLIIDCSGSMGGYTYPTKMDSAKLSAQMFVGSMNENDKIGIVEFDSAASITYPLTKITGDNIKTEAKNAISALYAGGGTSIGAGLQAGHNQLTTRGADDPVWVMVLLSDGHEGSTTPMTKDVLPDIIGTKTKIYTIGLGEPDESLLGTIAWTTGGFYRYCASSEDLVAIYQDIQNSVAGFQTIAEKTSDIIQGAKKKFTIFVDSVTMAIFQAAIGGSDIDLVLVDPNGNEINPVVAASDPSITYISGTAYKKYIIESPQSGDWEMEVTGTDVASGGEPINVAVSADTDVTLTMDFDKIEYVPGGSINVIAGLEDSLGPILGATVTADVQTPFGDSNMVLYDDGAHGDKAADDGIYAIFFDDTSQQGNYTFKIDAAGTSNEGNVFTRTATKTTVVGQDTDGDGMANTWEDVSGLNPNLDDSAQDPDGDGLTNLEEYNQRTNPQDADTDGDGYSDKEEVDLGSDPLDFDDVPVWVTAACKDISIQLDGSGNASISASQVDGGSIAINGINTISVAPDTFSTDDIGENIVTLTVTDAQGNVDECDATVTVSAYSPPIDDQTRKKKDDDDCFIETLKH